MNHLVDSSFQDVNRPFVLSFGNENDRKTHLGHYLPKVKIKDCNVMIDGKTCFDQPVKMILKHLEILGKLLLIKEMITQLVVCYVILTSKKFVK